MFDFSSSITISDFDFRISTTNIRVELKSMEESSVR